MQIAIVGPGAIGSTFAYQLARKGHSVTVVARGARLALLQREGAIVSGLDGSRAAVTVADRLDASIPYDLVLVTVLATQVGELLPALGASAAKKVMFMFNTFESIEPLRQAVGPERFAFGFPAGVFCLIVDGKIHPQIRGGTTAGDSAVAQLFTDAGIPTEVDDDMQSWLRTHAALVAPLMSIGTRVVASGKGLSWGEAAVQAVAFKAGMQMVKTLGNSLRPKAIASLAGLPTWLVTALLWAMSRTKILRDLGKLGPAEPRMLVEMMTKAVPTLAAALAAIRP